MLTSAECETRNAESSLSLGGDAFHCVLEFVFSALRILLILFVPSFLFSSPLSAQNLFSEGTRAYEAGHYEQAATILNQAAFAHPSAGTLQNLGNAQWQSGQPGPAILAWERALWLDPYNAPARGNLRFARKSNLLETPELPWYELCSTWLPIDAWPWVASASVWLAAALVFLPGIFRWRKRDWHQVLAAAGFAIFLLAIPALVGVQTRSKMGVILERDTPLRLTPTADAQIITRLPSGETARFQRERGNYLFIRTPSAAGWVQRDQFGLITRIE